VLDKRAFPRDKTCAGWITPAVVATLGLDLEDYRRGRVLQPIHGFRVARMGEAPVYNDHGATPVSYGIRRREFDYHLLQRSGECTATAVVGRGRRRRGSERHAAHPAAGRPAVISPGGARSAPIGARRVRRRRAGVRGPAERQSGAFAGAATRRNSTFSPTSPLCGWSAGDWLNVGIGRRGPRSSRNTSIAFSRRARAC
jgi:hypothetical protein